MTVRQWYLGMAVAAAAAALIPPAANATNQPNLLYGGAPGDYNATGTGDPMEAHFGGVTTETAAVLQEVQGVNNGGSCGAGGNTCQETTWGVGTITQALDTNGNKTTWNAGDPNGAGATIAYVLYDIADKSVTITGNNGVNSTSYAESIANLGATASNTNTDQYSPYGNTTGAIQLDLYYMPTSNTPCFVVGCGPNFVGEANRTANTAAGVAQVAGITDVGTPFAAFTLQPGVTGDSAVTLTQSLTASNTTGKVSGGGGTANFYAECYLSTPPGPGCSQFAVLTEANSSGPANEPDLLTQIFGQISYSTLINPPTGNASFLPTYCFKADGTVDTTLGDGAGSCAVGPYEGYKTTGNTSTAGYLISTTDPVRFAAGRFTPVPEPGSLGLLGTALAFLGVAIGRRRRKGIAA